MGRIRLASLSRDEANALQDAFWSVRHEFLAMLDLVACKLGLKLGANCTSYTLATIDTLDELIVRCVSNPDALKDVPVVPEWLAELHDPIDENVGLTNGQIWLGLAASFVISCAVLRCVQGTRLGVGYDRHSDYIYQNQPVIKGKWYDGGNIEEVSAISLGRAAVRRVMRSGEQQVIRRNLDKKLAWARENGVVESHP